MFNEKSNYDCPCGGSFRASLNDFANGRSVRCNRGHDVTLSEDGNNIRGAESAMRDLDREISKLNRTIKFKF